MLNQHAMFDLSGYRAYAIVQLQAGVPQNQVAEHKFPYFLCFVYINSDTDIKSLDNPKHFHFMYISSGVPSKVGFIHL